MQVLKLLLSCTVYLLCCLVHCSCYALILQPCGSCLLSLLSTAEKHLSSHHQALCMLGQCYSGQELWLVPWGIVHCAGLAQQSAAQLTAQGSLAQLYSSQLYSSQLYSSQLYSSQLYSSQLYSSQLYSSQLYSSQLYSRSHFMGGAGDRRDTWNM